MVDGSVWVGLGALVSINLVVINWVPLVGCAGHGGHRSDQNIPPSWGSRAKGKAVKQVNK